MSISLNNHEDRIKVLEKVKSQIIGRFPIESASTVIDCKRYYDDENVLYILSVDTLGYCEDYQMGVFGCTVIFDKYTTSAKTITHIHNVYYPRQVQVENGIVSFIQQRGTINEITGWLLVLKLYYSFSYNIIYRATHLLEKIFLCLKQRRC